MLPISLLRRREGNVAAVNGRLQGRLPRGAGFARGIPVGSAENDVLVIVAASSELGEFIGRSIAIARMCLRRAVNEP